MRHEHPDCLPTSDEAVNPADYAVNPAVNAVNPSDIGEKVCVLVADAENCSQLLNV